MRSPVGVSATVQVGHRDLTEHEDPEEDDGDALVRYVEAVPGQNFEVRAHLHHNFLHRHDDINIVVWIDGKWTASQVLTRNSTDAHFRGARRTVRGQSYLQRFCFAELKTTDESAKGSKKEDLKDLGVISIKFTRGVKVEKADPYGDGGPALDNNKNISEKSLKGRAISNHTSFGAEEKIAPVSFCSFEYPYGKEPFAELNFKYRSRHDLQIEGVLERSPSPVPLEERDPATLTREELQQLLAQRNREREDYLRVKREKRERSDSVVDDNDDDVSFTGEGRSKRSRTSNDSGVELIDLTGE